MGGLPKLMLRIGKFFLFSFGITISAASLALGTAGKLYSTQSKDFINSNTSTISNTLDDVTKTISSFKDEFAENGDVSQIYAQLDSLINNVEKTLTDQRANVEKAKQEIESFKDKVTDANDKKKIEDAISMFNQIIDKIGYPSDAAKILTTNTSDVTVFSVLNQLKALTNDTGSFGKDKLESLLDQTISIMNTYVTPVQNFISSWNNEEKVNSTYDLVSTILLAFGATMIGVNLVGYVLCGIVYKRIDGKLVSRMGAKKELKAHIDKLFKKYPYLKKEFIRGME